MRLGQDQTLRLRLRGEEEEIGRLVVGGKLPARDAAHEVDALVRPAGRRPSLERPRVAPLPDQEQARTRDGLGDGSEGLDDPLDALLAIEAADVQADRGVSGEAQPPTRRLTIPGTEAVEVDPRRHHHHGGAYTS